MPSDRKYEADGGPGIRTIMGLLLGSSRADDDRRDFFKTQILYWLLCAIDGHAKNFSLFLEAGGGYRLTPRYDVLSEGIPRFSCITNPGGSASRRISIYILELCDSR